MAQGVGFICLRCGYRGREGPRCPRCGFPLIVEPGRFKVIKTRPNIWRYEPAIGVPQGVTLGEGLTPLKRVGDVLVKDEGRNPTGSYADRGSAVVASAYSEGEAAVAFEPDFALSLGAYLSAKRVRTKVYVDPEYVDYAELLELLRLRLVSVEFGPPRGATLQYGDPYFLAGVKTIAYEIYERVPRADAVVVPVGKGLLALAVYEGFRELEEWGLMPAPKIILAKHRGAPAAGDVVEWLSGRAAVEEVEAEEAVRAVAELAGGGIYAKPLSAMAYAAARGIPNAVAVITGTGLRKIKPRIYPSVGGLQQEVLEALRGGGPWPRRRYGRRSAGAIR
ncbi:MAG: pyridoxal-phosphate dependent enzyme [Thermoproteus sp. AZ2]|uniref:Pyridoxal-phosphate dependent enzyme n=1 Tax=Thermoproteus sp. AZ2 TaxID=1609232 RepID=A0ACC6UZC8_9CREN